MLNLWKRSHNTAAFGLTPAFNSAPAFGPLKEALQSKPFFGKEPPKPVEKRCDLGMLTEGEVRRILIEESIKNGDHATVLAFQLEDSAAFLER